MKIGGVPEHFNIPWIKSIDEGVFSREKINLEWENILGGTGEMIDKLENNSLDIAIMLTEGAIKAINDGRNFKIIHIYINTPLIWGVYTGIDSKLILSEEENIKFLISRFNSGSHIMAYFFAEKYGWKLTDKNFIIINNFSGALSYFNENSNALFLWEKFMSKPYVDNHKIKKIDEIIAPWPSFSLVVKSKTLEENYTNLKKIIYNISSYSYKFNLNSTESIEYISNFYNLKINDVKDWINLTQWNYKIYDNSKEIYKVRESLYNINYITLSEEKLKQHIELL